MTSKWLKNFVIFSLSFSLTHASVICVLAYSSTLLGATLGGYGSFVLYVMYAISSLLFSRWTLQLLGPKWTVFCGLSGLQLYVISFFFALLFPSISWWIFLFGAFFGGLGAGVLWVGQSMYFSYSSELHIEDDGGSEAKATTLSNFAGYFAFLYLLFEVLVQLFALLSSLVQVSSSTWQIIVFGTSAVSSICGTLLMYHVIDVRANDSVVIRHQEMPLKSQAGYACNYQMFASKKLLLPLPYQICFGLSSGLTNYYVNKYIVAAKYGDGYVGLLAAIGISSSALAVYPITVLCNKTGNKAVVIVAGCLMYMFGGTLILILPNSTISEWSWLIPLYVSHGIGRSIWEGANKALVSDYFISEDQRRDAYAAIYFVSGLAAAFSFVWYQYSSRLELALLNVIWPIVSIVSFLLGHYDGVFNISRSSSAASDTNENPIYATSSTVVPYHALEREDDEAGGIS